MAVCFTATVPLDVAPVFQEMWVVPLKMIVPTGGSVGPPSACGHASGWVLVIEAVDKPELGPPPAVYEQPLKLSGDGARAGRVFAELTDAFSARSSESPA